MKVNLLTISILSCISFLLHNKVQGWKRCWSMYAGLNFEFNFICTTGQGYVEKYEVTVCETHFWYSCTTTNTINLHNRLTPFTSYFKRWLYLSLFGFDVKIKFFFTCCKERLTSNCKRHFVYPVTDDCYYCSDDSHLCKYKVYLANISVVRDNFKKLN